MAFSRWTTNKKKNENEMTLSDIIRGLQFCVNSSTEIAEQHYETIVERYIDDQDMPVYKRIRLDDQHYMDIPLTCLTEHNALAIDELQVKLNVNIRDLDLKEAKIVDQDLKDYKVERSSLIVDICNLNKDEQGNTNMDLEMKFKASNPPEALSRLIETLNNAMVVRLLGVESESEQ